MLYKPAIPLHSLFELKAVADKCNMKHEWKQATVFSD